ncbi:MAG TPA: folate-binding protein, partial [Rhodospirillales bacterium]|nr:folate-binding protein [Rhodospirillales bacterium]
MSGLRRVDLAQRCLLAITGADRRDFLQGLITADLRLLSPRRALWGALLTPQGKYLFDFFLLEPDDGRFLLEADARRAPALVRRLSMYRL